MDLSLSELQVELVSSLERFLSRECTIAQVRAAEATGFDSAIWNGLVALSAHSIGLPAAHGGFDASLLDLALCSELYGKYLAPVPVLEAAVVGRLLARCDASVARALLSDLEGGKPIAIALTPLAQSRRQLVRCAALTRTIVALDGDVIVAFESPNAIARVENMGSEASAVVDFNSSFERKVIDRSAQAPLLFAQAIAEWKVLMAAMLAGLGEEAIRIGANYTKERTAFGRPIGSFQAVAHRLADAATAIEGAKLIARTAAEAAIQCPERFSTLASMAFIWASISAQRAAADALHVHGGYGFTLEYDIQLYVRRAKSWPLALHDLRTEYQAVAADLFDEPEALRAWIFLHDDSLAAFRKEVRGFIAEHVTPHLRERAHATGTHFDWQFHKAVAERGWLALDWPPQSGGAGESSLKLVALQEEFELAGVPYFGFGYARNIAGCLHAFGTEQQKSELIPRLLAGELLVGLGYSEPHCGSDVAAARTQAVKAGDGWLINGQKMFTTIAEVATHVFLLTRTSTEAKKHQGLTLFIAPLDRPGVKIQQVKTLGGERTNITYYSDVFVSDAQRVGEVGGGWDVMIGALKNERPGGARDLKDRLLLVALDVLMADRSGPLQDPVVRERLAHVAIENEVARLLGLAAVWHFGHDDTNDVAGPMFKLFSSESLVRSSSLLLDTVGPFGLLSQGQRDALGDGLLEEAFRHSHVTTIYAGTSEVQRSIIAERGLGLPRGR